MLFLLFFVASIFNFYFFYVYIIKPQSHTNVIKKRKLAFAFLLTRKQRIHKQENNKYTNKKTTSE